MAHLFKTCVSRPVIVFLADNERTAFCHVRVTSSCIVHIVSLVATMATSQCDSDVTRHKLSNPQCNILLFLHKIIQYPVNISE